MPKVRNSAGREDTARGDILWLNPWPSAPTECSKPVHDIFNHPVMIVWLDEAGDQACVLIVSANAPSIFTSKAKSSNALSYLR